MAYQRDPLSVRFDVPARKLVRRAYNTVDIKGLAENPTFRYSSGWTGDYVPPPGPRALAWARSMGIGSLYERDRWGEIRWLRAYKRSVFHLVNWYGGVAELRDRPNTGAGSGGWHAPVRVQWETGIRAQSGDHAGYWAIRIRLHPNTRETRKFGLEQAKRESNNWIGDRGEPNFRQSLPADRPWEAAR